MTGTPTLELVAPSKIKPHTENVRAALGDLDDLAASIAEQGILEPLVVAPTGHTKQPYLLIAGHRRLAAAKQAGLKQVPVVVRDDLDTLPKQLQAMLVENGHRANLTAVEEGAAYQQLLTFDGFTQKSVAQATGHPVTYVRERIKVTRLGDKARDRLAGGQITLADAVTLADFAEDPSLYARLERAIGTYNWTYEVTACKRIVADAKASDKIRRAWEGKVDLVDRPAGFPYRLDEVGPAPKLLNALDIDAERHTDCPGHAGVIHPATNADEPIWVCLNATEYHPTPFDAADGAADETEEERAERETAERVDADLEIAAEVRLQHLADVVRRGNSEIAQHVLVAELTDNLGRTTSHRIRLAGLLGLPLDADAFTVTAKVQSLSVAQLAILYDLREHTDDEGRLLTPDGWTGWIPSYDPTLHVDLAWEWVELLEKRYDYQFSDVELQMIEAREALAAQAAAAKNPPALEDVVESV